MSATSESRSRGTWWTAGSASSWQDVTNRVATALAEELGGSASATSVEKAITEADVVVFAVWLDTLKELIAQHADLLRGKVVVDPRTRSRWVPMAGSFGRLPTGSSRAPSLPG